MKLTQWLLTALLRVGLIVGTSVLFLYIYIISSAQRYIYKNESAPPHAQAAVILGAAILSDGTLSPVLEDRVDAAIRLYQEGIVENILVTGDNSSLAYNEVNPVRLYLLAHTIPDKDIFLDHAGFDTYSSMYRARDIFLTKKIIIVSQSFHLPRALFIAHSLGIDAYGMNADRGHYLMRNYTREVFADVKALGNLVLKRQPKYLGKEIPITGKGNGSL